MRSRWSFLRFAVLTTVLVPALAVAQAPVRQAEATPGRHFVWRVAKEGKPVAWLVGSVHLLRGDAYPLPEVFNKAFSESGTLVEEIDFGASADPAAALPLAAKAVLADGRTLSALLDRETYLSVEAKAAAAGLPMMLLDRMKPWLVAVTLTVPALRSSGLDPAFGLDRHFYDRAMAAKRPVRGLETAAYQIERLDGLPMPVQIDMLRAVLADVNTQLAAIADVVDAWKSGDVSALDRLLLKEFREFPEVYRRLLVERNQAWVPQIAACVAERLPCLVVVGGAHLVGPDSVVSLLRQSGFSVEQQ